MKRQLLGTLSAFVIAACGSKAPAPATTPAGGDGHDHEHPAPEPAEEEPTPAPEGDGHPGHEHDGAGPAEPPPAEPPAPDPAQVKADLLAAETSAYEQARPVFEKYCSRCHSKGGKGAKRKSLGHFEMTTYPFGGHHAHELGVEIRKALAVGGGEATMPMNDPGAVKGAELALIVAWAAAFDKAHAAGAHEGRPGAGKHAH